VSAAIHAGIGILAIFVTWTVGMMPRSDDDSVLIVADFNALNYEPVARFNAPPDPAGEHPAEDRAQSARLEDTVRQALSGADADADPLSGLWGAAAGGSSDLAQFAPGPPKHGATFVGLSSSNARRIVYAIDASGSMIAYLQIVLDELARSLQNLSPSQSFAIIFFQGNVAIEVPPAGRLVPASAMEKTRAMKWIDDHVVPAGGTNPLVAIERALALRPDVVFLLSQDITGYGQFEVDQQDLITLLDKLNPVNAASGRRAAQINCIQFLDVDQLGTMERIAKEHGGPNGFKFLTRKELGLSDE
jgi:hypothetical protein